MKRPPGVQQALRGVQRVGRRQYEVVRRRGLPGAAAVQRTAEAVARPRVPGPAGGVPVPAGVRYRSGSGSASQDSSSELNRSGVSSWGKWPAPSISRHR
jgi:hypothetical protein